MPTITLGGDKKIQVGDDFTKLSPDQQEAFIRKLSSQLGITPQSEAEGARAAAASRTKESVKPEGGKLTEERPSALGDVLQSLTGGFLKEAGEGGARQAAQPSLSMGGGLPLPSQQSVAESQQAAGAHLPFQGPPQTGWGEMAGRIGQTLGNPLTWMGPESALAKLGLGGASGSGAYLGGQVGGKPGEFIGAGLAPVGAAGVMGAAKAAVGRATPERQADVTALRTQHGIEPRAGDVLGKQWLRRMEQGGDAPFGGNTFSRTAEKPLEQYTSELAQSFGQNSNRIDPITVQAAHRDLGQIFESTVERIPIVITALEARRGNRLADAFAKISQEMNTDRVDPAIFNRTMGLMDRIQQGFETKNNGNSVMEGTKFHELTSHDSPLRIAQREGGLAGHYANLVEGALVEAIERSARRSGVRSEAYEQFKDARRKYANLLTVERAMGTTRGEAGSRGLIEPRVMQQVLTSGEVNKYRYARGEHDLGPITRDALKVISPYRAEGTPLERASPWTVPGAMAGAAGYLGTGSPWLAGVAAAGGMASAGPMGRFVNSPGVQEWLKTQAMRQGGSNWYDTMRQAGRGVATALYEE